MVCGSDTIEQVLSEACVRSRAAARPHPIPIATSWVVSVSTSPCASAGAAPCAIGMPIRRCAGTRCRPSGRIARSRRARARGPRGPWQEHVFLAEAFNSRIAFRSRLSECQRQVRAEQPGICRFESNTLHGASGRLIVVGRRASLRERWYRRTTVRWKESRGSGQHQATKSVMARS